MSPLGVPRLSLLERVLSNHTINAVIRGDALARKVPLHVYNDQDILGVVKLPQAPNYFFGYVPAPEDSAGYQIVVFSNDKSAESDFWLTQGKLPPSVPRYTIHHLTHQSTIPHYNCPSSHRPSRGSERWWRGWRGGARVHHL